MPLDPRALALGNETAAKARAAREEAKDQAQRDRIAASAAAPGLRNLEGSGKKKSAAKKPAAKKLVAKKTVAKKTVTKKPVAKKTAVKKTVAKKK